VLFIFHFHFQFFIPPSAILQSMRRLLLPLLLLFVACTTAVPPSTAPAWQLYVDRYVESYYAANPHQAVYAGLHQYDGQLPDWSRESLRRRSSDLRAQREQALAFAGLSSSDEFERRYLINRIDQELFWLDAADWPARNPIFYSNALSPSVYVAREYAPLSARMEAMTGWAEAVPTALGHARENLRPPLTRPYVETAIGIYGGMATYLRNDVPAVFSTVEDGPRKMRFLQSLERAAASFEEFRKWLESELPRSNDAYALGPELYRQMLISTELVDVDLDRLWELGNRDVERNLARLADACRRFDPSLTVEQCVAKVEAKKPPDGPVAAAQRQLAGLRKFVIEKDLVTIPSDEEARVVESPPYQRANSAYIEVPGAFEKGLPATYYISPPDPRWTKEEQAAYIPSESFLLGITVHEVWPGHFLKRLHGKRNSSKIGRLFSSYAFSEGWAHYSEEMMIEAGLADGDPEIEIGQILNALLRDVRYLSAIGLHTRGMTVEQSEELFRTKAYRDAGTARQQARRGTYDPAYLNYTLGKLMVMKLREDWTATRGGRAAWKEFHDLFLSFGLPPVPLVRERMMGDGSGVL
jgi:hypothetical protein